MQRFLLAVLRFPLTRIVLAFLWVALVFITVQLVLFAARLAAGVGMNQPPGPGFAWLTALVSLPLVDLAYRGYVRVIERRPTSEMSFPGAARELGAGALVGGGLMALVVVVLAAAGAYRVTGLNSWVAPLTAAGLFLPQSYWEEVLTRLVLFRITEEALGSWIALAVSSAFFGFAHALNPGASAISSVAIAVEAGVLLGAGYMLTRRIWFVAGLHFAWNFVQGGVFGAAVSGLDLEGLLRSKSSGPDWLTGGTFGPEASLVTVAICTSMGVAMLVRAARVGQVRPPFWARPETSEPAIEEVELTRVKAEVPTEPDEGG